MRAFFDAIRDLLAWYNERAGNLVLWTAMFDVAEADGVRSPSLGRRLISWLVVASLLSCGLGCFWFACSRDASWTLGILLWTLGASFLVSGFILVARAFLTRRR